MLYDITMKIDYTYEVAASGARQVIRVLPMSHESNQRLIAGSVSFSPAPDERVDFNDFFRNAATAVSFRKPLEAFEIRMQARVQVENAVLQADLSPTMAGIADELFECWSVEAEAPHHFLKESPSLSASPDIAAWTSSGLSANMTIREAADMICSRIHDQFTYDPGVTKVDTPAEEAFKLRKGVCQDFAHIMIIGLRSVGVPAGYVSGYLRTIPPSGKERLEGADAMHAWVRVWCGRHTGWMEWDPTNNMMAGADHIRVGYGRDYTDVAPVIGVLKSYGSHSTDQSVDVVPIKT